MTLIGAALSAHGLSFGSGEVFVASLDHTVWFHRPFRADDWWLYDQHSPAASNGRGLVLARVFSQRGAAGRLGRAGGRPPEGALVNPTQELVDLLDLEEIDTDLFRGRQPETQRARVYGGQVAAQALIAGIRTVEPEYAVHSLHSYFLLGGDYSVPIVYDVERIRDGRSFVTRRVVARQHGRAIYYQSLNFQRPEDGWEHQDAMPRSGRRRTGSTWST